MPRNTLKSFPTAALRRGVASFHPASRAAVQPLPDSRDGDDRGRGVPEPPAPPVQPPLAQDLEPVLAWG